MSNARNLAAHGLLILGIAVFTPANAALTISNKATQNVTCSSGVCSATAKKAVLNVNDLANMLAASALSVKSGKKAQDIVFDAPFSWAGANGLTLDAYRSLEIHKPVSDAGPALLTLTTDDGGSDGVLLFAAKGRITFLNTSNGLHIDGKAYTLVDSLPALIASVSAHPSGAFALIGDYDASADGTYASSPITDFSGSFNGLGNAISNLTVAQTTGVPKENHKDLGLFAVVESGSSASSLELYNINILASGERHYAGALAGENEGMIFNVNISGQVTAGNRQSLAGGLIGYNGGTIDFSHTSGEVSVGTQSGAGGLVGYNEGSIVNSYATGFVNGGSQSVTGGAVGSNQSLVSGVFATGSVSGSSAGGLVGSNSFSITNSYATGSVNSTSVGGGFVGTAFFGCVASYSTGLVQGNGSLGGFEGWDYADQALSRDAYWDITTSKNSQGVGSGDDPGVTGLTDAQLKSGLPSGFDPAVWAQNSKINNGYPYLIANSPPK